MRALLLLYLFASTAAVAQPAVGTRVRVVTAERTLVGTVVSASADTLVLEERPSNRSNPSVLAQFSQYAAVSSGDVEALERHVRNSRGRSALRGALIGAGISAAAVLATATALDGPESMGGGFALILGGMFVVPSATILGAGIGALAPGGQWVPVAGYPVTVGAARGVGLSVRVAL